MQTDQKTMDETLGRVFLRIDHPVEIILTCVRWYVAYPLSVRHLEEMMAERRSRCCPYSSPRVVDCRRKRPVGKSWRMDETYIKVAGQWKSCTVR